jgi:hypothetical protein
VTSQYFNEWTTLAAPFSSTLIFNTARPQEDFKELLEDEAFQRPCGTISLSLSLSNTHRPSSVLTLTHTLTHTHTHLHTHTHTSDEALEHACRLLAISILSLSLALSLKHTNTNTPARVWNLSLAHSTPYAVLSHSTLNALLHTRQSMPLSAVLVRLPCFFRYTYR